MHGEQAQAHIVKAAEELRKKLGSGWVITIVAENTKEPNKSKGMHVCTNLSSDTQIQAAYLEQVSREVKSR